MAGASSIWILAGSTYPGSTEIQGITRQAVLLNSLFKENVALNSLFWRYFIDQIYVIQCLDTGGICLQNFVKNQWLLEQTSFILSDYNKIRRI